jgi:hypothetical protein
MEKLTIKIKSKIRRVAPKTVKYARPVPVSMR